MCGLLDKKCLQQLLQTFFLELNYMSLIHHRIILK